MIRAILTVSFLIAGLVAVSEGASSLTDFTDSAVASDSFLSTNGEFTFRLQEQMDTQFSFWGLLFLKPYTHRYRAQLTEEINFGLSKSLALEVSERSRSYHPRMRFFRVQCRSLLNLKPQFCQDQVPYIGKRGPRRIFVQTQVPAAYGIQIEPSLDLGRVEVVLTLKLKIKRTVARDPDL